MKLTYDTTTAVLHLADRIINAEAIPDLLFLAESIIEKGVKGQNTHTAREVLLQIATRAMETANNV
jgi:hypothetical protein